MGVREKLSGRTAPISDDFPCNDSKIMPRKAVNK